MAEFLFNGLKTAKITLVLAHGAGGPMDSPFMTTIAEGVSKEGIRVARFEFPYMRRRRETGKGSAPETGAALMQSWREAIEKLGGETRLVIGGKSLGGRIASMIADEIGVRGLVCLGYPFHPPGKPEQTRTQHLERLRTPALILQGTRDAFGKPEEVEKYKLSKEICVRWLRDSDHSFKPRASSGLAQADNLNEAITYIMEFMRSL
jgi:predicted alpha/beta-hydrolase family hydrolase